MTEASSGGETHEATPAPTQVVKAAGYGTDAELEGSMLRVTATGKMGRGALGTDERIFDLANVRAIKFVDANPIVNGRIEILDDRGKTVLHFRRKSNTEMKALYDAVAQLVPSGVVVASTDAPMVSEDRDAMTERMEARRTSSSEATPVTGGLSKSADERKTILDRILADRGAHGWWIETRSDFQGTIATGNRINHILHLFLTIITAGIWAIVWICLAIFGGIKRHIITIDEYGNVADRKI
jgi:hypothetical protein